MGKAGRLRRAAAKSKPKPEPKSDPKPSSSSSSDALSLLLPCEVVVNILSRLPVKSLVRLKAVSKPWLFLISDPAFVHDHLSISSLDPLNDSLVIHSITDYYDHVITLFHVNSPEKPFPVDHPFPDIFLRMDLVGSSHGLVCLSCPPLAQAIVLWNPATRMYKFISLSSVTFEGENPELISLGFGFDPLAGDFKIVRILCLKPVTSLRTRIELYTSCSDSWKQIKPNFPFFVTATRSNAIVDGVPYWTGFTKSHERGAKFQERLVYFDVRNEVFGKIPTPPMPRRVDHEANARFVGLKDGLGCLMCYSPSLGEKNVDKFVDVFVFEERDMRWKKKDTVGPISRGMTRMSQCAVNGEILVEDDDGELYLYYPKTKAIRDVGIEEAQPLSYEAFGYTESLVNLEGMIRVGENVVKAPEFELEELFSPVIGTIY